MASPPLRDAYVHVREGRVAGLGPASERPRGAQLVERDLGRVVLTPGFVNAHTHLELSHLAGAVSGADGFVPWIEEQLRVRAERPTGDIEPALRQAIRELSDAGTVALADVSNSLAAVDALVDSTLHALVLHEVLGFDPSRAGAVAAQTRETRESVRHRIAQRGGDAAERVTVAVAAHAPHSLSRELFALLLAEGIRSIHLAESKAEDVFLATGKGEWRGFLDRRVGPIPFAAAGARPVRYVDSLSGLTPGLLAVHCVRVDEEDAKLLAARGCVAVLCPRSNEFLGNGVPPLALLLGNGVSVALGTDSLASCPSLNVIDDARRLARLFPRVPAARLLEAATRGGARALGFADLGEIRPGACAGFASFACEGASPRDPLAFVLQENVAPRRAA